MDGDIVRQTLSANCPVDLQKPHGAQFNIMMLISNEISNECKVGY